MSVWKKVRLGGVCLRVFSGGTPSRTNLSYYENGNIPWLNTGEVNFNEITSTTNYITQAGYDNSAAKWVKPNSVIVAMYGATAGKSCIARIRLTTNQACCNLEIDDKLADYRFVYYIVKLNYLKLASLAKGGAQQNLNAQIIREFPIPLPPLPIQQRIASILSDYDAAIANCRRQIALLEEAAQRLYREWFAEGKGECEKGPISKWFDVTIGRTPPRKVSAYFSQNVSDMAWCSIADIKNTNVFVFDTAERLTKQALDDSKIHVSPPGTILLSFKLTVGRVAIAATPITTNEAIAHFETTDRAFRDYTYCYLKDFKFETLGSTSSIGTAINSEIVKNMPFLKPSDEMIGEFSMKVSPMFDEIEALSRQIRALTEARDRLLPKLMSGEVAV